MIEKKEPEEFEIIPLSPIRKMEKRISQLEVSSAFDANTFFKELVDIIKMNQQIVDEMAKANDALRIELSRLPARLEEVTRSLNELISYIKAGATEESAMSPEAFKPMLDKLDQIVESNKKMSESNQQVIENLEDMDKKLRRPSALPPLLKKPMPVPIR